MKNPLLSISSLLSIWIPVAFWVKIFPTISISSIFTLFADPCPNHRPLVHLLKVHSHTVLFMISPSYSELLHIEMPVPILSKVLLMYDMFGHEVFKKINVFDMREGLLESPKTSFSKKYGDLGFEAIETKKVPFDIIAKKEKEMIITEIGDKVNPDSVSLSRLLDADNLVIFKKKKPKDIPSLKKEEFFELKEAKELIKYLKEF